MSKKKQNVIEIADLGAFSKILGNTFVGYSVIEDGVETWHPNKEKKLSESEVEKLWKKAKGEA